MRSTIWCVVCSACLTLLASPDSAGGGLGRARVVSSRGVLFSVFFQNSSDLKRPSGRVDAYQYECKDVGIRVVKIDANGNTMLQSFVSKLLKKEIG